MAKKLSAIFLEVVNDMFRRLRALFEGDATSPPVARKEPTMPTTHALLIGIDFYFPNRMPDNSYYASLHGCVRDVDAVTDFLRKTLKVPENQITRLSASNDSSGKPPEPKKQWPTYANMVSAFKSVTKKAASGDNVFIHYSGHGGRADTLWPELKSNKLDEGLVPTDIGDPKGQYLRDVEIAHLLKAMTDKGLLVTVVFDSCHSGGATRGRGDAVPRRATPGPGVGEVIDTTARPASDLVASPEELAATWNALDATRTRAASVTSSWPLEPQGYTLLAACRASESAYEFPFEGGEKRGALTYWMLDTLKVVSPTLTYKELSDQVIPRVHGQFASQTPQLQGIGDRLVFGEGVEAPTYSVLVMQVLGDRIQIGAGQNAGLRNGAEFAVYPTDTDDFTKVADRIAILKVSELGAVDSWMAVEARLRSDVSIQPGMPALLLNSANVKLKRTVHLHELPADVDATLTSAIEAGGGGFIRLVGPDEEANYQVAVSDAGNYEIWDPAGMPIPNLRPALAVAATDSDAQVARRLVHLAKFSNVLELANRDTQSPLADALSVELLGVQDDYDPVDGPQPKPFTEVNTLTEGQFTFLRIKNNLKPGAANDPARILNVTVLNLAPDWAVEQIYPQGAGLFEPLDPGDEKVLPIRTTLPDGVSEGTDILKVFASRDTPNLRWLTLTSLDKPSQPKGVTRSGMSPLDQLLAAVAEDGAPGSTRSASVYTTPSQGWTVSQVEIRTKKA